MARKNNQYKAKWTSKGNIKNLGNKKSGYISQSGSVNESLTNDILKDNGVINRVNNGWMESFSRFSYIDPYNAPAGNKEYVFFTKPDLNLFETKNKINPDLANDSFFVDYFNRYRHLMRQLQYSLDKSKPYLYLLSHAIASSPELPDIVASESESSENLFGDKMSYRHGSQAGDVGFEFSCEFNETKHMEIYNLFKMWDYYELLKTYGVVRPPSTSYITNMEAHDKVSMYKIIVGDDNKSILFYAKYYGVYPKNIPRSTFSNLDNGQFKITVDFHADFVIDKPYVLEDLNMLANRGKSIKNLSKAKLWDSKNNKINRDFVGNPFVLCNNDINNGKSGNGCTGVYQLEWRD